jgi:NAD(P)H-dependent flavin oxidoreductase YrpB (nitropropane dioxygenase family)
MPNLLCETLGIDYPIILGGMGLVGTAPLIAAVSSSRFEHPLKAFHIDVINQ